MMDCISLGARKGCGGYDLLHFACISEGMSDTQSDRGSETIGRGGREKICKGERLRLTALYGVRTFPPPHTRPRLTLSLRRPALVKINSRPCYETFAALRLLETNRRIRQISTPTIPPPTNPPMMIIAFFGFSGRSGTSIGPSRR